MTVSIRLDTREFAQAMREYVAATGKDSAQSLNRQGRNFAIKCVMSTKNAKGAGAIKALRSEPWWPKFIAKVMAKQAGAQAGKEILQSQWAAGQKAARDAQLGKGQKAFKLDRKERSYAKYANKLSGQILRSRSGAITFLRFFFRVLAKGMTQYSKGGSIPAGKEFPGFTTSIEPAVASRPSLAMRSSYKFKNRGQGSATGAEKLLQEAMGKALAATVVDMKAYTQGLLAKRAAQFSGRKS